MISILMPVKNAEPFLQECLESIIYQSEKNWELIAVNDHSTDLSESILKQFSGLDSRITYFNNTGKGIIDALALAFANSKGELITRMDADDVMLPLKLSVLKKICDNNPTCIATGKVKYISEDNLGEGYLKYEQWLNGLVDHNSHYHEIYKECVLPSPNWMMSKQMLNSLGGFKTLDYPEDYDLCFKAYQKVIPIVGATEITHHWRDYPERTSRNDPNYTDNRFTALKVQYFCACELNADEELILWGAGKRGKAVASELIKRNKAFKWITNNQNKIGHLIYDQIVEEVPSQFSSEAKIIVAIAGKETQNEIRNCLEGNLDVYWFC